MPGDVRLDVSSAVTAPLTRKAVCDENHVPDLGPPTVEPVVEDETAADSSAEREQDEAGEPSSRPELPLRQRGGIRVVLDPDRETEALARVPGEVEVVEREVRRAENPPRPALEVRGNAEPDRPDAVVEHRLHGVVERLQHGFLGGFRAVLLVMPVDDSLPIDETGADLRPAHVDSDHEGSAHGRGLP